MVGKIIDRVNPKFITAAGLVLMSVALFWNSSLMHPDTPIWLFLLLSLLALSGGAITAAELRGLNINRTIENGLRYLWVNQSNRTTFDTTSSTSWGNYARSFTALTVLAFENHGYKVPNSNAAPTGLYEKYAVNRGLNYVLGTLTVRSLTAQTAGDPCVGPGISAAPCLGYSQDDSNGYSTALASLALSGSSALSRTIQAADVSFSGNSSGSTL